MAVIAHFCSLVMGCALARRGVRRGHRKRLSPARVSVLTRYRGRCDIDPQSKTVSSILAVVVT